MLYVYVLVEDEVEVANIELLVEVDKLCWIFLNLKKTTTKHKHMRRIIKPAEIKYLLQM